jgi:hypothetical protein
MGNFAEPLTKIQQSLPSSNVPFPTMDPAWHAKIARAGSEVKGIEGSIKEEMLAYASTMIPQTIPNTQMQPNAGSLAAAIDAGKKQAELANDLAKVPDVKSAIDKHITGVLNAIETNKTTALSKLDQSKQWLSSQTTRTKRLYADKVSSQIDSTKQKVITEAQSKKELINYGN